MNLISSDVVNFFFLVNFHALELTINGFLRTDGPQMGHHFSSGFDHPDPVNPHLHVFSLPGEDELLVEREDEEGVCLGASHVGIKYLGL